MPKVLIVDNNSDARELYKHIMTELVGLKPEEVVALPSGTEALEYLERNEGVKLVLLDLAMPVLDGLTTAEEIRRNEESHNCKTPTMLALLTGYQIDEVDEEVADRVHVERPFLLKNGDVDGDATQIKRWLQKAA